MIILQIVALVTIALILVEGVLYGLWSDSGGVVVAAISILLAYAGFLSRVFFGEQKSWGKRSGRAVWKFGFTSARRLVPILSVLVLATLGMGWLCFQAWHTLLVIHLTVDQAPIAEEITITVRTAHGSKTITTTDNPVRVRLSRGEGKDRVFLSAESVNYGTSELFEAKPRTVSVPLVRRSDLNFDMEIAAVVEVFRDAQWLALDFTRDNRVRNGDQVQLRLKPSRDTYLYVFLYSEGDEKFRCLYPLNEQNARVAAQSEVFLPEPEKFYRVFGKPGREKFIIISSALFSDTLNQLSITYRSPRQVTQGSLKFVRRGMGPEETASGRLAQRVTTTSNRDYRVIIETLTAASAYRRTIEFDHVQ